MRINPAMLVLAREYRALTQQALGQRLNSTQARIAKYEGGLAEIPATFFAELCRVLDFPPEFFEQSDELLGMGTSAYYYRKKSELASSDRKKIHALVNVLRLQYKLMLNCIDLDSKRKLPKLYLEDYADSPAKIAQALRAFWNLPDGPIRDLTDTVESAGVLVIPCQFGTRAMDATSIFVNDGPPMVFINDELPADRWRFTLAHELGHLVMHDVPHESMEDEADSFAAELLLPESELRPVFEKFGGHLRLVDLSNLKQFWKTSIGALLMRAHDLDYLSKNQSRYLWQQMGKMGWRVKEPIPLPVEKPATIAKLVRFFIEELRYSVDEMSVYLRINLRDLYELHPSLKADQPAARLRLVQT